MKAEFMSDVLSLQPDKRSKAKLALMATALHHLENFSGYFPNQEKWIKRDGFIGLERAEIKRASW